MKENSLFTLAIAKFDEENAADPRQWNEGGESFPQELWFSERHTEWVKKLCPEASEALLLASRCQHICRWEIPRQSYPMDRAGYLTWRADLKKFHAEKAGGLLREVGYSASIIDRVKELNLKKNLKADPECQVLEDALCLTFLQYQFDALIDGTEEEKMIKIVRKTWGKMSEKAHAAALELKFSEAAQNIVKQSITC